MRQRKAEGRFIVGEILVFVAIVLLLACMFMPVFWRLDKNDEMNLRTVGMVTWLLSVASLVAWFIKWLFGLTRPIAILIAVLLGTGMLWLFK